MKTKGMGMIACPEDSSWSFDAMLTSVATASRILPIWIRLNADESLEKCEDPELNHMLHPSCSRKLADAFQEGEWEGLLLCRNHCFKQQSLVSATSKAKERAPYFEKERP